MKEPELQINEPLLQAKRQELIQLIVAFDMVDLKSEALNICSHVLNHAYDASDIQQGIDRLRDGITTLEKGVKLFEILRRYMQNLIEDMHKIFIEVPNQVK